MQLSEISSPIKRKSIDVEGKIYEYELKSFKGSAVASFGIILYEICATLTTKRGVSFYKTGGLFSSVDKALDFFNFITENLVTPQNLPYVVEDCFYF